MNPLPQKESNHTKGFHVDGFLLIELLVALSLLCSFIALMAFNAYKMRAYEQNFLIKVSAVSQISSLMEQLRAGRQEPSWESDSLVEYTWSVEPKACTVVEKSSVIPATSISYNRICVKGSWSVGSDAATKSVFIYGMQDE